MVALPVILGVSFGLGFSLLKLALHHKAIYDDLRFDWHVKHPDHFTFVIDDVPYMVEYSLKAASWKSPHMSSDGTALSGISKGAQYSVATAVSLCSKFGVSWGFDISSISNCVEPVIGQLALIRNKKEVDRDLHLSFQHSHQSKSLPLVSHNSVTSHAIAIQEIPEAPVSETKSVSTSVTAIQVGSEQMQQEVVDRKGEGEAKYRYLKENIVIERIQEVEKPFSGPSTSSRSDSRSGSTSRSTSSSSTGTSSGPGSGSSARQSHSTPARPESTTLRSQRISGTASGSNSIPGSGSSAKPVSSQTPSSPASPESAAPRSQRIPLEINGVVYVFEHQENLDAQFSSEELSLQFCKTKGIEIGIIPVSSESLQGDEYIEVVFKQCVGPLSTEIFQRIQQLGTFDASK